MRELDDGGRDKGGEPVTTERYSVRIGGALAGVLLLALAGCAQPGTTTDGAPVKSELTQEDLGNGSDQRDGPFGKATQGDQFASVCRYVRRGGETSASDAAILGGQNRARNYGSFVALGTGTSVANVPMESLISFDLSFIPLGSIVDSAELGLFIGVRQTGQTVRIHRAAALWDEGNVTYESFGQSFDPAVAGSFVSAIGPVTADLTALAQTWVATGQNDGLLMEEDLGNGRTLYYSADNSWTWRRPVLKVCYTQCAAGFSNCDGNAANGCETPSGSDSTNCGACGNVCAGARAVETCDGGGSCQVVSCDPGFSDCDGNPANGCETDLSSAQNCGGCGNVCNSNNACLADSCDPNTLSCVATPVADGTGCDDGNVCTSGDQCAAGACGGAAVPSCCNSNNECTSNSCQNNVCQAAIADGGKCQVGANCASDHCQAGICRPASCFDGAQDGAETAVDCGGGACNGCAAGQACTVDADCQGTCQGNVCVAPPVDVYSFVDSQPGASGGATALADFFTGVQGKVGPTSWIDVSIDTGSPGNSGEWCSSNADWYVNGYLSFSSGSSYQTSGSWEKYVRPLGGTWGAPVGQGYGNYYGRSCDGNPYSWCSEWGIGGYDIGIMPASGTPGNNANPGESYSQGWSNYAGWTVTVRVGASKAFACTGMAPVGDGSACKASSDCINNVCQGGTCRPASCGDGVRDSAETDVDCGGGTCAACRNAQACNAASDCLSQSCQNNLCHGGGGFIASWAGRNWYKVQVNGTMTDAAIYAACQGAGLNTPCQTSTQCGFNDNLCDPGTQETSCGNPMMLFSQSICGGQYPNACPQLDNVFQYMGTHWSGGCGAHSGQWCAQGDTSTDGFALCVQ